MVSKKKFQVNKLGHLKGHTAAVFALANGLKQGTILSGAGEGWVVQWSIKEAQNGTLLAKVGVNIYALESIPDKGIIVAGDMNGGVHWININEPALNKDIEHHKKGVFDIKKIKNKLFTLGGDGLLSVWDIKQQRCLESIQLSNNSLRSIAFCEPNNEMAIGSSDQHIYILDADSLEIKRQFEAHDNSVFCLNYSADGQHLFSGGRDAHLKIWDTQHGFELVESLPAHWFTINSLVFHPKGHLLATGSRDKTIRIWDAYTFKLLKVIDVASNGGHINSVNKLFWSTEGQRLISASDDQSLIVWEITGH